MRKVLLDANLLIGAYDKSGRTSPPQRDQAKQTMNDLLSDESVAIVITPLVRYEVLRGVDWDNQESFIAMKQILDGIAELEVDREVSELAADLFRFDCFEYSGPERNIDKRRFDAFHLATAKQYSLELASQDSDIASLEDLYNRYKLAL